MTRLVLTVCGGCVCGLGAAVALTYIALMFGPDNLLEF